MSNLSVRDLTKALISDEHASRNDGTILTRLAEAKRVSRGELKDEGEFLRTTELLPDAASRKSAIETIERYLGKTATGFEASFSGVHPSLAKRMEQEGISDAATLLAAGASPAQRQALASKVHASEPEVRALVKQADLMRAGVEPALAYALVAVGVDSIPELAGRNVANLRGTLKDYAAGLPFLGAFKLPTLAQLGALVASAKTLPKLVEFGPATSGFASLPVADRAEMLLHGTGNLTEKEHAGSAASFLNAHGAADQLAVYEQLRGRAHDDQLHYLGHEFASEVDEGYQSFSADPEITLLEDAGGQLLGARFRWYADTGSEGISVKAIYDHTEKKFTGYGWSESANGESDFETLTG